MSRKRNPTWVDMPTEEGYYWLYSDIVPGLDVVYVDFTNDGKALYLMFGRGTELKRRIYSYTGKWLRIEPPTIPEDTSDGTTRSTL